MKALESLQAGTVCLVAKDSVNLSAFSALSAVKIDFLLNRGERRGRGEGKQTIDQGF